MEGNRRKEFDFRWAFPLAPVTTRGPGSDQNHHILSCHVLCVNDAAHLSVRRHEAAYNVKRAWETG